MANVKDLAGYTAKINEALATGDQEVIDGAMALIGPGTGIEYNDVTNACEVATNCAPDQSGNILIIDSVTGPGGTMKLVDGVLVPR